MPFDPASITAPFRMQPGLRRIAERGGRLTPHRPGDTSLAAKLDVLSRHADQALCVADGWDNSAAFDALCRQAQCDDPQALVIGADGRLSAPLLGWSVSEGEVCGDGPLAIGDCLRALPLAWRQTGLLCLAFAEDFAVLDGNTALIPWLAVCLPSHWMPQDKVGRHFAEVHAPVADNDLLLKAGESLARLVSGTDRWERFVWTITPQAALDAHPLRHPAPGWSVAATADELAAAAWLRTEHQTFIPVPGRAQAVFTIHVEVRGLADVVAQPGRAASTALGLHAALATMSPAVLAYRGLAPARERLLQWLASHGGEATP